MPTGNQVNVRRITELLIVLLIGFFASGCAFGARHVTLSYPPESNMGELSVTDAAASTSLPGPEKTIAFFQFKDLRPDKGRIGNVQNALGMDTADVIAENDVAEWINNAIIMELEGAGYKVIKGQENNNTEGILVLKGNIREVYVTAYFSYDAEVSLLVELELDNKVIMREFYNSMGSVGLNWAMTADSAGESLSLALADVIRKIVQGINAQLYLMKNP